MECLECGIVFETNDPLQFHCDPCMEELILQLHGKND